MKKIVVIGSANMDVVISVPHIPVVGETILARDVHLFCGGKGANQAVAAGRLGGDVRMIGCVGNDDHGRELAAQLKDAGIDTRGIALLDDAPTGNAYINVSDRGENNIVVNAGANNRVTPEYIRENLHLLDGASYCVIQLEIPLLTLYCVAEICRERGIRLILNPAPATAMDFEKLQGVYMIAPNESELDLLVEGSGSVEEKARTLLGYGFEHVLVTLGAQGCLLVSADGETPYPAYEAFTVQDTTAAGDSFIGALVTGLARGEPMDEAIGYATVAAAITVSRPGAQPSLPTWSEVDRVMGH